MKIILNFKDHTCNLVNILSFIYLAKKISVYFGPKIYFFYFRRPLYKNINIIYFTLSFNIRLILPLFFYYYFCPFTDHSLSSYTKTTHIQITTNSSQDTISRPPPKSISRQNRSTKISKPPSKPSLSHFWQSSESWWAW